MRKNSCIYENSRSTSGCSIFYSGCLIGFKSNRQVSVAKSSTEAEIISMANGLNNLLFVHKILQDPDGSNIV
jgi:hypothetical protein